MYPASNNSRRRLILLVLGITPCLVQTAFCANNHFVYNDTTRAIQIQREDSDRTRDWVPISSGGMDGADMSGGNVTLRIQTYETGNNEDYFVIVTTKQAATVHVKEENRSGWIPGNDYPPNIYCTISDGDTVDNRTDIGVGDDSRNVRFLVTADVHYDASHNELCRRTNSDAVVFHMKYRWENNPAVRGIIIAGDLTGDNADDDIDYYLHDAWGNDDNLRYVFDGVGNHDGYGVHDTSRLALLQHVRNQKRVTPKTNKDTSGSGADIQPHYSWDWQDVHFVHLNLYAGTDNPDPTNHVHDPRHALEFLEEDLQDYVGDSERPVVLIQHFGFENFSSTWWSDDERLAMWNAIKNYNVIAIFCGHDHLSAKVDASSWYVPWDRPSGASGGPDSIPTFVSGAGCGVPDNNTVCGTGAFLDVRIDDSKIYIARRNTDGDVATTQDGNLNTLTLCLPRRWPIYVDKSHQGIGGGSTVAPYNSLGNAMNAASCSTDIANVRITAGDYPKTGTYNTHARLIAVGGTVRIGR